MLSEPSLFAACHTWGRKTRVRGLLLRDSLPVIPLKSNLKIGTEALCT